MKRSLIRLFTIFGLLILTACSKEEAPAVVPAAQDSAPVQQQSGAVNATGAGQLGSQVDTALQQKNYTAAVDALAQASRERQKMSDAQRLQYMQQMQQTMEALAKAAEHDAAARAAYERLGRAATGR